MVIENGEGSKQNGENMVVDNENEKDEGENEEDDITLDEVQANKRVKTGKARQSNQNKERKLKTEKERKPTCEICFQTIDEDLRLYNGHPNDATDEFSIVLHPKLCLFTGQEEDLDQTDFRAFNKITHFSVYDKNGHLVPFDSGLIERNVFIYFSGYVKAIYEDDPSIEGGIPGMDLGPIVEWAVSGFDGGEQAIITFTTEIGEYALMEPSEEYAPFMVSVREKTFISKTVIEFLCNEESPSYEDLLNKLTTVVMPKGLPRFTEDILLHHAQFLCDQVLSFDEAASDGDELLITTPCMRALIDLAGITFKKGKTIRKGKKIISRKQEEEWRNGLIRKAQNEKKNGWTKATTTPLVNYVFDSFFPDQLAANSNDPKGLKRKRCGVCEPCQQPDCGACTNCKSMIKFGGPGRSKQACIKRRCPNMEIQQANDNEQDDQEAAIANAESSLDVHKKMTSKPCKSRAVRLDWVGNSVATDAKGTFYKAVEMDNKTIINIGDCVFIEPIDPTIPLHIVKVVNMWETSKGVKMFHGTWLWRGSETVLGETSSSSELFLVDDCQDIEMSYIKAKTNVMFKNTPDNWTDLGNISTDSNLDESKDDITSFYYQKRYDPETARFEDVCIDEDEVENKYRFCAACTRITKAQQYAIPFVREKLEEGDTETFYGLVKYRGEEFRVGSTVYLQPKTFKFKYPQPPQPPSKSLKKEVDEERFPEYYRKANDRVKGSNVDTPEPFDIGYIVSMSSNYKVCLMAGTNLKIKVKKLYRPENTHKSESLRERSDVNMLYWSEEECIIPFSYVVGKCYLAYADNLDKGIEEWSRAGPNRFYFSQMYLSDENDFDDPPSKACMIGASAGKKNSKAKSKSKKVENQHVEIPPEYPKIKEKLRTLDVFAGCGGLSEGLHKAGLAESKWAIEVDEAAAHAYRLNNPNTAVFTGDCNAFLEKVIKGDPVVGVQRLPQRGEVDLLCGGPPCQGFSGMNRFNSRAYSLFKNSLVVSYLSYCDYYRPRFFIMENVRNFVSFKKSLVLKLTLRCLVRMGYQCTFGILQAGNFGVPQTRRRMIILAAAPGEILPQYPDSLFVFSKSACNLSVVVDNKKYSPWYHWTDSAPYRVTTVRDALSDLPRIKSGFSEEVTNYGSEPVSHFQRKMREGVRESALTDHICKDLGSLVEARMAHIPTVSGSDWRDLPNIVIPLSDGSHTNKLKYLYHDKKAGVSSTGALRGVCRCATGKECNPLDRQDNTLIPWCLPHTGNRHNHWAGLYGRVEWDGFFSTTITNPEPMGKQGRVLHPDQTRVVSVRECARSQGFPDSFRFYGNIQDKHRQVGNAVPPPLAAAIGLEIMKCVSTKEAKDEKMDRS